MSKVNARIVHHRISTDNDFTPAPNSDFEEFNGWTEFDLADGEIGVNLHREKVYANINGNVKQITTGDGAVTIDTTPIIGGSTGAIFYEKVDHTFGEIMGFQYDDSHKTLSYFDDVVSPEVVMLMGKLEIVPGVFIPYSGFGEGNNPMTDMGIAYLDATLIGSEKQIFLGKQFESMITISDQNINLFAGQNATLSADQNVNINADQNVYLNADQNVYLNAYQNVNLTAGQNFNLTAYQNVNLTAYQNVSINSDVDIYLDAKQIFKLDIIKKRLLFSKYGFQLINTMGGGVDNRFQYSITDGVKPDQFGIFGASPVIQQSLSIDPSTLPTSNDTETTVKEIAQALINYGLLTL